MFKVLKCTKTIDTIHLTGQLKRGACFCQLPVCLGENHFMITVLAGKLRLNHGSFDPDGGIYMAPPGQRQQQHYNLNEGCTYDLTFKVDTHFGRQDIIDVVNLHMLQEAIFQYRTK